jgi:uncharacterized membrane protein
MVRIWFSARLTAGGAQGYGSKAGLRSTKLAEPLPNCCLLSGDKVDHPKRKRIVDRNMHVVN